MNSEFQKYFPSSSLIPILRNLETNRYWINEYLLKVQTNNTTFHIAQSIIEIIDAYIKSKQHAFESFVKSCEEIQNLVTDETAKAEAFILGLLATNVDARLFEIVSYAILKYYYHDQQLIWGYDMEHLNKENLKLYKTGRTNANDGGIDFVMKPLGRFFQVTESLDFRKYFLDIDKIQKYPITFVIKSDESVEVLYQRISHNAQRTYPIKAIIDKYMSCIEEIINIPILHERFQEGLRQGNLTSILSEIITQSKVEFNQIDIEE